MLLRLFMTIFPLACLCVCLPVKLLNAEICDDEEVKEENKPIYNPGLCEATENSAERGLCRATDFLRCFVETSIFEFENVLNVEWHRDHDLGLDPKRFPKDDFVKMDDKIKANLRWREVLVGAQLNFLYYPDPLVRRDRGNEQTGYKLPEVEITDSDMRLEKVYFVYDTKKMRIDVGDYYVTFGRGLALSMRKEAIADIDNTLRGGKLEIHYGDVDFTALAGITNINNVHYVHNEKIDDPEDLIGAVRVEQRLFDFVTIGGHAVNAIYGAFEHEDRLRHIKDIQTTIWGGTFEIPDFMGYASLYFEGDYIRRSSRENDILNPSSYKSIAEEPGSALYGSLSLFVENLVFNAEYKRYRNYIFKRSANPIDYFGSLSPLNLNFRDDVLYNNIPTLERTDLDLDRHFENDHGFKLRADYYIEASNTQPYAAFYYTHNEVGIAGEKEDRIWHVYSGFTQHLGSLEIHADGGYRDETNLDENRQLLKLMHGKLGTSFPVAPRHVFSLESIFQRKDHIKDLYLEDNMDATFSYTFKGWFVATFYYTMQRFDTKHGNPMKHYYAGELTSRFSETIEVSVFGGQVREGIRCSGAGCKKIPAFEGVKGKVTVRF